MIRQNLGDADRAGRILVGGMLAIAFFLLPGGTTLSLVVGLVSVDLLVTSLAGWSPLYAVLRKSTRSNKDVKPVDEP
jgi:hypothetical protein